MSEHKIFVAFLALISIAAALVLGIYGFDYYLTPLHLRPFLENHDFMRPAGFYSHGLGILGTALVVLGVSAYSTRKRIKALWGLGRLSVWLQFHIVVCLIGPILVIFHTTFKAGGIAAISLWTMISVWLSGMIGRFLYVRIPRSIDGTELTDSEIQAKLKAARANLETTQLGKDLVEEMDRQFQEVPRPDSVISTMKTLAKLSSIRRLSGKFSQTAIRKANVPRTKAKELTRRADEWITLMQKAVALNEVARLFHYWHLIHLPFTIIMFITLAAHVAVTILVGYTWIF